MLNNKTHKQLCRQLPILVLLTLGFIVAASASVFAVSAEYTQSYMAEQKMSFGTLVSLQEGSESRVVIATASNAPNFIGVSIADSGSTVAINKNTAETQVAVSGKAIALVSNINGDIKKGDLLTVSNIDGVAAKALNNESIIGSSEADFDITATKNTATNINTTDGKNQKAVVGPAQVNLFRIQKNTYSTTGLVGWIERVSGKPVSVLKLAMVSLISLAVLACIITMSYSAIRNTVVQASRNPLARPVIVEVLVRVLLIVLITAVIGASFITVVLKV